MHFKKYIRFFVGLLSKSAKFFTVIEVYLNHIIKYGFVIFQEDLLSQVEDGKVYLQKLMTRKKMSTKKKQ